MKSVHFYGMLIKGLLKFLLKIKIPVYSLPVYAIFSVILNES